MEPISTFFMMSVRLNTPESGMPEAMSLGGGHDVRDDAKMFEGKPFASAAKSRLDFIEDEHDAVLVTDLAQALHE